MGLLQKASTIITHYQWIFTVIRWSFILLLFVFWPKMISSLANTQCWSNEKEFYWLRQRWLVLGSLLIFDLICNINF